MIGRGGRGRTVALEQLVYGSFPFWDRGYDVLARSPGCRPDAAAEALLACRRFGQAPSGVGPEPCLFALPLPSDAWAVVGVAPQGEDDRGRPGALAFHVLLIAGRDYRRAGAGPFAFAGALRSRWSPGATLGPIAWAVETPDSPGSPPVDPRAARIVEGLRKRRRVAIESEGPVDALAREVWRGLPRSTRGRLSVATWAFGNANRFDLVALPRMAGVDLDRSYLAPAPPPDPAPIPDRLAAKPGRRRIAATLALALILVGIAGVILAWRRDVVPAPEGAAGSPEVAVDPGPGPPRARVPGGLRADLADLAGRFEGLDLGDPADAPGWMLRLSATLRYRGAVLSPADLARLRAESDPDRDRALAWHGRIGAFGDDRPLPADFAARPLAEQLRALAGSFGVDRPDRLGDGAIVPALAAALCRDGPVRPTPLAARYPPLSEYARFLGRLPRLDGGP